MPRPTSKTLPLDPDVLDCLLEVMDPEIGLSVVDLGLLPGDAGRQWHRG